MKPMKEKAEPDQDEKNKFGETTADRPEDVLLANPRTEELFDGAMQAFLVLFQRVAQEGLDTFNRMFATDPFTAARLMQKMCNLLSGVVATETALVEMQVVKSLDYRERAELELIRARRQMKKLRQQMLKAARSRTSPSDSTT